VFVAKTTPKSEMARGFMDVRRVMKAMEGHTQMIPIDQYSV
jgi:hypothetical protein